MTNHSENDVLRSGSRIDPQCARFVHLLPMLIKGRFSGSGTSEQFSDGDLTVRCPNFAWERKSTEESGKGLANFMAMFLDDYHKEAIDPSTARWIIDSVADNTSSPVQLDHLLDAICFATGIRIDGLPQISRKVQETIDRIKATGPRPDQKHKLGTSLLLRLFRVVDENQLEHSGGNDEDDAADPYFAVFGNLLRAMHEIETAITDYLTDRSYLDVDRNVGNLVLSIRNKVVPQLRPLHREAFALVPAHAVGALCYQMAKLITMQPEGQRHIPKPRPLAAMHVHYDYDKMVITRVGERDASGFFGSIKLPILQTPVFIQFSRGRFDESVPRNKIKWVRLGYRTDPKHTLEVHQGFSLAVAFNAKAPATVLQKVGRRPTAQMQAVAIKRMYYHDGMKAEAIADRLSISVRSVRDIVKQHELPPTWREYWPTRRRAMAPLQPDPEDIVS
jgi:hypothetical protein